MTGGPHQVHEIDLIGPAHRIDLSLIPASRSLQDQKETGQNPLAGVPKAMNRERVRRAGQDSQGHLAGIESSHNYVINHEIGIIHVTGQGRLTLTHLVIAGHVPSLRVNRMAHVPILRVNGTAHETGLETRMIIAAMIPAVPRLAAKDFFHTVRKTTVCQENATYSIDQAFLNSCVQYVQQISIIGQVLTDS